MHVRDHLGQITPGASSAVMPPASGVAGLWPFYLIAVAAGVTVFLITKALDGKGKRR